MSRLTARGETVALGVVLAAVLASILVIGVAWGNYTDTRRVVPKCQEDAVVVGRGDFTHGRWDRYACGASVDDYQRGEGSVKPLGVRLQQTAGNGFEVIYDPVTRIYSVEPK